MTVRYIKLVSFIFKPLLREGALILAYLASPISYSRKTKARGSLLTTGGIQDSYDYFEVKFLPSYRNMFCEKEPFVLG